MCLTIGEDDISRRRSDERCASVCAIDTGLARGSCVQDTRNAMAVERNIESTPPFYVAGIGASAGGGEALTSLVAELRLDLPAAVIVVLRVTASGTSVLAQILDRAGPLPAVPASEGDEVRPGTIYVAPPDRHVFVRDGHLQLTRGPRENGFRPSVDVLFRSAARSARSRVIGVILTGALDDGTAGLWAVKRLGGLAVVQDPEDAMFDAMPRNAMAYVDTDAVVPL